MKTSFEKLPAVKGSVACLTCGAGAKSDIEMDTVIAVGFGFAGYSKDGKELWSEGRSDGSEYPTVATVEKLAKEAPDHDWRIYFFGPMWEGEYQRQGKGVWVLIKEGQGFA